MDKHLLLERALDECGDDIDSAIIRRLTELNLGTADNLTSGIGKVEELGLKQEANLEFQAQDHGVANGAYWAELFVKEMVNSTSIDEARIRATRSLELFEKSINTSLQQENMVLKEKLQALAQENALLKRAVLIQHEREKEYYELDKRRHEVDDLKQMVSQYKGRLTTLEVNNYSLTMHLKQAQQGNSIPGYFHPHVF